MMLKLMWIQNLKKTGQYSTVIFYYYLTTKEVPVWHSFQLLLLHCFSVQDRGSVQFVSYSEIS